MRLLRPAWLLRLAWLLPPAWLRRLLRLGARDLGGHDPLAVALAGLEGPAQQPEPFPHAGQPVAAVDRAHARRGGADGTRSQVVAHGEADIGVPEVQADRDSLPRRVLGGVEPQIVSWAIANQVSEAAITDGLIFMAIVMVLVRTAGLRVRASRLPDGALEPQSA